MSRSVNRVALMGNVGADPDIQETGRGVKIAHLKLATNRWVPTHGAPTERTEWHKLTVWNRLASFVEANVRAGDRIYIEGRIEYEQVEVGDGRRLPVANIAVTELVLLTPPKDGEGS